MQKWPKTGSGKGKGTKNPPRTDNAEPSTSHGLECGRSDKNSTKPEEDSRRRTIIVERQNASFGFTIQSYGIHYKKEQEIEMMSYVDSIDFNGPAAKAGMREGDVILSINGIDMEKADHSTLVNFIKTCETRMRMVVLFEDCVRRVDLQRRALEIQKNIQDRQEELNQILMMEDEIIKGLRKTHSLPSKKKKSTKDNQNFEIIDNEAKIHSYCRPTLSTEDVTNSFQNHILNGSYTKFHDISGTSIPNVDLSNSYEESQSKEHICREKEKFMKKCSKSQKCNPCYQTQDNNIEAYDLASPCCEPNCVPRRAHHHNKGTETNRKEKPAVPDRGHIPKQKKNTSSQTKSRLPHMARYQCVDRVVDRQLSCNSSEASITATTACDSGNSHTSLSSDTLFWDAVGSQPKISTNSQHHSHDHAHQNSQMKPKSCDNFTTKAFGGYGFGYGFSAKENGNQRMINRSNSANKANENYMSNMNAKIQEIYSDKSRQCNAPTKSTESLLVQPEYPDLNISEPSISCDCLNIVRPEIASRITDRMLSRETGRLFINPTNPRNFGYYSQHIPRSQIVLKKVNKRRSNSAEITRL